MLAHELHLVAFISAEHDTAGRHAPVGI